MRPQIVADSSALFSLLIQTDKNHHLAASISKKLISQTRIFLIPAEIFAETINILGKKTGKKNAILAARNLLEEDLFTFIESTSNIRINSFEIFKKQPESVSFTDCLVMATADEYKTKYIFGFDETFRKNGYVRIEVDKKGE